MNDTHLKNRGFDRRGLARAALIGGALFAAQPFAAMAAAASAEELDQRIRVLERQLEIQKEDADTRAKDATTTGAGEKGFSFKKGDFELNLKALVQADGRFFTTDSSTQGFSDGFLLRRAEPSFQGSLGKLIAFTITPQFAESNSTPNPSVVDVYVDLKFHPAATVRVGRFKTPVGLETLQSSGTLTFIERGLPNELAPGRDFGVQLQGKVFDSTLSYALGLFNGAPDGRDATPNDSDNRHEIAARIFAEPFKNDPGFFQNLGIGAAGSRDTKLGSGNNILPRYRSPGQNQFFFPTPATNVSVGAHTRLSPQAYFYKDSLGALAEYVSSKQELATASTAPATRITNKAWQVVTSYVLTGEDATYRGVAKPDNPCSIGAPGWGAVEVAARYGVLDVDDAAFPAFASATASASRASAFGVGVNWYLTTNLKLVLDYDQTRFKGGGGTAAAPANRPIERAIFARAQISY